MNLLGLTRVQAKYFFYHSVAAITPAVPTIPLPLFYLCYNDPWYVANKQLATITDGGSVWPLLNNNILSGTAPLTLDKVIGIDLSVANLWRIKSGSKSLQIGTE